MSVKTGYFRLGLFVIGGSLALVVSVVYLGAGEYFVDRIQVETYFKDAVQGLDVGAPVKYRGVPVGVVQRITFVGAEYGAPDSASVDERMYVRVLFGIDLKAFPGMTREQITSHIEEAVGQGLRMRLAAAGLTGTAFLTAELLDPRDFPAIEVPWTPHNLYVPSAPSSFGAMVASLEKSMRELGQVDIVQLGEDLGAFLDNANKTIQQVHIDEVQQRVIALLDELRDSNAKLHQLLAKPALEKAIDDAGATMAGLREVVDHSKDDAQSALKSLRSAAGRVDNLLNDQRVETILTQVAGTAEQLPATMARLRGTLKTIDELLREEQPNLQIIIENLRVASEDLTRLTGEAKDYPARILFGDAPPRITLKRGQ
ncbi:MAG: MCE family protein [Phycisphaerales bacterium]|nr:MCE family protein [Phycisphaerales bacterium]